MHDGAKPLPRVERAACKVQCFKEAIDFHATEDEQSLTVSDSRYSETSNQLPVLAEVWCSVKEKICDFRGRLRTYSFPSDRFVSGQDFLDLTSAPKPCYNRVNAEVRENPATYATRHERDVHQSKIMPLLSHEFFSC